MKNYSAFLALIPSLIQFAETIHGPSTGSQKLATVTALAQNALLVAGAAGVMHPNVSTNLVNVVGAVEGTLSEMKLSGELVEKK